MSEYGSDASITGSLIVDGESDIGSGDDDIDLDAGTLFVDAANDRVGIGTDSPDTLLHMYGTSPAITLQRDNNSTGTNTINFEGVAGVVACKMGQVAGTDNELAFSTHDGANLLERMRIDEAGFIGIGTTAPEAYLDIKNTTNDGDTNRTMIQLYNYRADDADENDWAPTSIDFKIENVAGGVKGATARIATVIAPVGTGHNTTEGERSSALIFSTMDDNTLAEAMRINNVGNIGIGTTSPNTSAILEMSSSSKGVMLPRVASTSLPTATSALNGLMLYESDTHLLRIVANGEWKTVSFED